MREISEAGSLIKMNFFTPRSLIRVSVRDSALQTKDRAGLAAARLQIKRMKRRLRKLREAS